VANDKKFIVKNGLLTQETVVIGSTTDNGLNKLQVTGSSIFTQATGTTPTINITNTGGTSNSIIAQFTGDSDSLQIVNIGTGDYAILNSQQNNGIRFHDGTEGVEILYNGAVDIDFNSAGIDFKREPTYNGAVFWNANNDGSGSGLDADLLDGLDSTQFLRSDEDDTMNGSLIITGNLTVQGTTTTINTETILLADNIITLNSNYTGSTPTEDAGIEVERGTLINSSLIWDETNDYWKLISAGTDLGRIITTADEGSGNGFDADSIDGLDSTQFLRSDVDDTAAGNLIFQGTITVGNNTAAGATIIMDGQSGNRYIFSNNGEIGFLNSAFAYAAHSDASNNWRVLNDTYARRFIDADNNTYLLDPAGTSVLNTIDLEGQIRHNGDTDTYIGFNAADSFEVRTGGSARLTVTNSAVTATQDFIGPRFVDSNNNAYFADPASASVFNTLGIDSDLFHNGDTDNKISFGADVQTFQTGGTTRLTINNTAVTSTVDFVGPRFVDSANLNKFADPAGTSEFTSANFYNGSTTANNEVNIGRSATERFNINVTNGQGYIRYYQDETNGTDHSVNFEIISSSIGLNRFNFNKNIDVGSNSVSGAFGVFSSGVYGSIFYDFENELFFADFNNTGNSINMAGTIRGGNGSLAAPTYTFGSDTNTGMYRFGTDTIGFSAGGNDEFRILTTYALAVGQMRSPIFYDSNNTAYFGDFASTSNMNRIDIDDYIRHRGDTDTYFGFSAADTIVAVTANTTRLTINTTGVTSTLDVTAPNFYGARFYDSGNVAYYADPASASVFNTLGIDSDLFHNGDTDNKIQFTIDTQTFQTGGTTRLTINNTAVTSAVNVFAPQFYTNDYLIHNGDTNTYIGFDANDRFGVWTAGVKRINVDTEVDLLVNTNVTGNLDVTGRATIGNSLTRPNDLSILTNSAARIGGSDVHLHIASLSATGNFAVALQSGRQSDNASFPMALQPNGGNVGIGTLTAGSTLTINKTTAQGNNPFVAGASLLSLGDVGIVDFSIRTDSFRNIWNIVESTGQFVFADSGAAIFLAMDAATGDVIVGDQTAQFATPDGSPTFLGALDANKLHVNGGIQLNGIANALSIYAADAANTAINEATFLAVNELGFSAGGGFFMNDTATMRIRGNKALLTTGDITAGNMYAARYYDADDATYYGDFATTSRVNDISMVGQIIHDGDTNTFLDFNAADSFRVVTGGTTRLTVNNTAVTAANSFDAPIFRDSQNTAYSLNGNTNSAWRLSTPTGWLDFGSMNVSFTHFQTDRPKFYFQQTVAFDGAGIEAYDANANAYFPRYFDFNDNFYYGDFDGFSRMNGITFGNPGNGTNTKGRWLSIEGNTGVDGEGSARIFFAEHTSTTAQMDQFGMSLAYMGGSAQVTSASGQPVTLNGLANGEWGLIGHNGTVDGLWAMKGPRDASFVQARVAFRAPLFVDSNNTAFFVDPASTSITNVMRANQFQIDGSTYVIDSPSGQFGSIRVDGALGGYAGYAIRDDWVFMADGATNAGIYNDTDNKWAIQFTRNAGTDLLFNGVKQAETENGYFLATNQMRAPIYYAPASTSYWLDLDVGNTTDALRIPGRINRQNFATGNGSTNFFLTAQDRNHFIWNTATNWGIFWATDTGAAYRHVPFVDNMITFVGAGNTRAAIDLDNGNAYFQGEVSAATFAISGGNENLGLLKTYGSGLGDTMLFDATEYWEKRVIQPMQGVENNATTITAEYVKNNNGPFSSSYVLRTNQYRTFDSDYIPVEPGEQIYGEIAARYISGTGSLLYMGVRRYDKDKRPIATNDGIEYFVASAVNVTSTGWTTYRGHTTIPTSHTVFNGSDGGGCKYVRVIVLMNYQAAGALREFGPPVLKRVNHLSNIATESDLSIGGNAFITGDLTVDDITADVIDANIFRDRADTAYYLDPASTAQSLRVRGEIQNPSVWINDGDNFNNYNENIRLFNAPNGVSVIAFSATGTSGAPTTSILGYSSYMERRFLNNWQERMYNGYLEASGSYRAPIFYDSNNTAFYGDFASTSIVNILRANQLQLDGSTYIIDSVAGDYGSIKVNGYRNGWAGYSINDQWVFMSSGAGNAGIYNDTNNQWAILAAQNSDVQIYFNGTWEERSRSGFMEARGSYRAPIFYDSNNTAYRIDGNGTSRLLTLQVDNVIQGSVNGYANFLASDDNRIIAPNEDPAGRLQFGFTSWNNNNTAPYADYLHLRSYTDSSGGSDNLVSFLKNGFGMRIWQQTWNSATAYSTFRNVALYNTNPGASNDLYASIYYDSNNTVFRVDPDGTSNIRYLKSNTAGSSSATRALTIKDGGQPEINFGSYPGAWTSALQIQNNNNTDFVWISPLDNGQNARFRTGGSGLDIYTDGGVDTGTYSAFIGSGSVRSPIFYDLNNTTFYGDFAGTSVVNILDVRGEVYNDGWFRNDTSGRGLYSTPHAMHWYADTSSRWRLYSTSTTAQILFTTAGDTARGYVYADNGNSIGFLNNGGNWRMRIVSGDWVDIAGSSIRAPIFYDNQDTSYYIDPNSSGRVLNLGIGLSASNGGKLSVTGGHGDSDIRLTALGSTLGSGVTSSMHWWVSEPGVTWNDGGFGYNVDNNGGTPSGFGRPNTSLGQGYMRYSTTGFIYVYNTNTSGTRFQNMEFRPDGYVIANNYLQGGNSLRAPIFYDSNDTSFYSDPNGGSRLNTTENIGRVGFSNYIVSRNNGGMMGDYNTNGTASKVIWTIGESWPIGNMYGLGYQYGGFGPYGTQHQIVLRENGTTYTQFGMAGNMHLIGSGNATGDWRAPIFYDSNNTAYYFDGASVNSTRFEGVSNRTKAMMGLPGRTGFDAEYYSARPRITGDVNYWTGAMGWGTIDFNNLAHWGSGFIDTWGNPGNQPSGTSHWVGTQVWHYTDGGNARYGWQMVGGPIGNLRFRKSWAGFEAWRTIPMLNVNDGNVGAMYANIYYDSDNTGFYCDPTGFTNLNTGVRATDIYARSWFRNDSPNVGLYNQNTGAHFYSTSSQYWVTAGLNGNDMNIRGLASYQGASRFWLHGATDGRQGFLNSSGSWLFRMSHNAGLSPGIWFYEAGESWTGNIGNDVGKLEYHANRMYIVSGANSDRIVQFRRDGTDTSWIANDGVFVGTATSARWADLAERYEADAIYEAGTILAIGGDKEVTLYQPGMPVAGAISVKPAYRMNDEDYGNDNSLKSKMNPFVALKGRIPVKINGSAKKGQWIIADKDGKGRAVDYGTPGINSFDIIGIALENGENEVEVKI
jgi:hypothetical protein